MKRWTISVVVVAVAITSFAFAQLTKPKLRGSEPYTPTKLEWLAVQLNCGYGLDIASGDQVVRSRFFPDQMSDAIQVTVTYSAKADRQLINRVAEQSREVVEMYAKARAWEWVQIREIVKPFEQL